GTRRTQCTGALVSAIAISALGTEATFGRTSIAVETRSTFNTGGGRGRYNQGDELQNAKVHTFGTPVSSLTGSSAIAVFQPTRSSKTTRWTGIGARVDGMR